MGRTPVATEPVLPGTGVAVEAAGGGAAEPPLPPEDGLFAVDEVAASGAASLVVVAVSESELGAAVLGSSITSLK